MSGDREGAYGIWDTERECWVASQDDPAAPAAYVHPFFARGMLDMFAGVGWEKGERYEVCQLPSDVEQLPLTTKESQ